MRLKTILKKEAIIMTALACSVEAKLLDVTNSLKSLDRLWKKAHSLWAGYLLLRLILGRRKISKLMWDIKGECKSECNDFYCAKDALSTIRKIRDELPEIIKHVEGIRFSTFIVKLLQREYEMWDEWVEDITIAMDPEFRKGVMAIYDAI